MNVSADAYQRTARYEVNGKQRTLVCDGALDHSVWDALTVGRSEDVRDQFIQTLADERLNQRAPSADSFGPAWSEVEGSDYRKLFRCGSSDGPHQEVVLQLGARSGNEFEVTTRVPQLLEHVMSGTTTHGELNQERLQEQIRRLS